MPELRKLPIGSPLTNGAAAERYIDHSTVNAPESVLGRVMRGEIVDVAERMEFPNRDGLPATVQFPVFVLVVTIPLFWLGKEDGVDPTVSASNVCKNCTLAHSGSLGAATNGFEAPNADRNIRS